MKTGLFFLVAWSICGVLLGAQEPTSRSEKSESAAEIPKGYEIGAVENKKTVSPDGRFALLYPLTSEETDDKGQDYPPNLLVRLRPYAVIAKMDGAGLPLTGPGRGWRSRELRADWNGNGMVAVWEKRKWGIGTLTVYEIENDKLKRTHRVLDAARQYFERDFRGRFLKKYPKEFDNYVFVSEQEPYFQFKGRRLILDLYADNKPNLAPGPHWSASFHGIWNFDTAKFEKADFEPGEIDIRPQNM